MLVADSQINVANGKLEEKASLQRKKLFSWLSNAMKKVSDERVDEIERGRIYRSI
jgi:hypothetical protein